MKTTQESTRIKQIPLLKTTSIQLSTLAFLFFIALLISSCQKDIKSDNNQSQSALVSDISTTPNTAGDMVLTWNAAINEAIDRMAPLTGSGPLPPMPESRICAMANVAMHDALNTIQPRYARYALTDAIETNASAAAAVAQAAHDIIVQQLPPQQAYADSLLTVSLNSINNNKDKTNGIAIGKASALAMIAKRTNDGSETAQYDLPQGTKPGEYRSTPPFDAFPFNGFMAVPGWGKVTPFALTSGSQFRTKVSPYPIKSSSYTKDYNELKNAGGAVSNVRTADQTQYAIFWLPNAPFMFNNIARTLIAQKNIKDAWSIARLLALVQMAEADANISCLDAKYYYFFWRPYTAIHLGDSDGNSLTSADTTWQPLAPPTPPVPDYPSNHACNGAAGATVIALFFGQDNFSFDVTSPQLPGVTRSFTSLSGAARENALSRIYVGYHFRHAVDIGEQQGTQVGRYVYATALKAL